MTDSFMTQEGLDAAFAEQTEEVWLVFVDIAHPMIEGGPLRLVRNSRDVTRQGNLYRGMLFDITLPSQHERQASSASLSVPNVDRRITDALRPLIGSGEPVQVTLSVALATDPDETQHGPWLTALSNVTWNVDSVTGTMVPVIDLDQAWPELRMDNPRFPGLFPG